MNDSTTAFTLAIPATEARQPEPERQPLLPIKLDAKRPSDRIRARVLHDGRIVGSSFAVAIALAEHVAYSDGTHSVRCIRQSTIKRWSHCGITAVKAAISDLVALEVLTVDRKRYGMRFVFRIDWLARWQPESERGLGENPDSRIPAISESQIAGSRPSDSRNPAISNETLCEPRSTHSAREGSSRAGPSPAQLDLAEAVGVQPEPGETGTQLYERIATVKRGRTALPRGRANKGIAPNVKARPCGCRDGKPNPTNYQCAPGWWQCTRCCERVECDHTHGTESYGGESHCVSCAEVIPNA